jgi:hypothetical protein
MNYAPDPAEFTALVTKAIRHVTGQAEPKTEL